MAIVFLGYIAFMGGVTYYYEVGELIDSGNSLSGQTVRVHGEVGPDIQQNGADLRFALLDTTGRGASIEVFYHGAIPDSFKADSALVVQGVYSGSGTFEAEALLAKCASRYTPAE